MSAESARDFEALERQAALLMSAFMGAGCEAVAPAIIQPADVFLDVIGEDLRARTYVFTDPEGRELCLRPDITVPTCRLYLARHPGADAARRYCYSGPIFRYQPLGAREGHPNEFRQAGVEMIGDADAPRADTDLLVLIMAALRAANSPAFEVRLGDLGLFHALLADLDMPERGRQRLRAQFWRPEAFRTALTRLTSSEPGSLIGLPEDLMKALASASPAACEARVADHLQRDGIEQIGARSTAEITASLLAAAEDARAEPIPAATGRMIESYLKIEGAAPDATRAIRKLLADVGPSKTAAVTTSERRLELMKAAGIDIGALHFSAEFGRTIEFYSGFVFDVVVPRFGTASPIAGGGRYDGLMRTVGAPRRVPAVGSAIHTERLLAAIAVDQKSGELPLSQSAEPRTPDAMGKLAAVPSRLVLAVPSKGRLMDQTAEAMQRVGLVLRKTGSERGYRGELAGIDDVDVIFVSSSEIAQQLKAGSVHLGITGEDLIREEIIDSAERVDLALKLGFGHADVVVAVPQCWLDVASMANLGEMARTFRRLHGRRLRVATKYMHLTRTFFRDKGVTDYLIVESLGATEGTPASGTADLIVDITSTGSTLRANGLKVLGDGVILRSEANLVSARAVPRTPAAAAAEARLLARLRQP